MRVKFITKRWPHHSTHSSYDQLVCRLGSAIEPLNLDSLRDKWIPGRVAVQLAARSGVLHYSYLAFFDEWAAARDMMSNHNDSTIYHVLYGDDSYRYLGSLGKLLKSRVVATFHQPPTLLSEFLPSVSHLKKLSGLIVVGRNQIPFFEPIIGSERVFFVPHGVDTTIFVPGPTPAPFFNSKGRCLFVGMNLRDLVTLRRVIELMSAQDKHVRFTIVTAESKRDMFNGIENVDLRHNVPEAVLIELYQTSDLLLQPLKDSTANNAILEGMACGLPIVATNIGAVGDYVDEKCGILVPPKDAEAMANAVLNLLNDDIKRRQMAIDARTHALKFDWSIVVETMRQVYTQLLRQ